MIIFRVHFWCKVEELRTFFLRIIFLPEHWFSPRNLQNHNTNLVSEAKLASLIFFCHGHVIVDFLRHCLCHVQSIDFCYKLLDSLMFAFHSYQLGKINKKKCICSDFEQHRVLLWLLIIKIKKQNCFQGTCFHDLTILLFRVCHTHIFEGKIRLRTANRIL